MSLPSLAPIPALLQPLASRAEHSWRAAVAGLEGEQGARRLVTRALVGIQPGQCGERLLYRTIFA